MTSPARALWGAVAVVGMVGCLSAPAHAVKPEHAGPPERETQAIVGSGEPVVVCGEREIRFVSGELDNRFRALPGDRGKGGFLLRDVTASDGETTFRVRGSGRFGGSEDSFTFAVHLVLIGPRGDVETVRAVQRFVDGEELPPQEGGSCTLRFEEGMP
jgi:hypothetical protein